MKKCRAIIKRLPEGCPLIRHCDLLEEFCNLGDPIEIHPKPCHGSPCSCYCDEVLDGGRIDIYPVKDKK